MAARPRKSKLTNVPNLYVKRHSKTGKFSCQYKDVRTGRFHGLGSDVRKAEERARTLNAVIGQMIIDRETQAILSRDRSGSITVNEWHGEYIKLLDDRKNAGELKASSISVIVTALNPVLAKFGKRSLGDLTTVAISELLKTYRDAGKNSMAQRIRSSLKDFFAEATAAGHFPADKPNPAAVTKAPRIRVKRARLTIEFFKQVLDWSKENQKAHHWHAYLLALTTGQRLSDIGNSQFRDVRKVDGVEYLSFEQTKTGAKVLVPMDLRLDSLNISVREVVSLCRDRVVSPYLLHHTKAVGVAKPGEKVKIKSHSIAFADAVRAVKSNWGENTPPSFHELRSLAEREYKKQGVNTQALLGHKHQKTTDGYADARGHDWIIVAL